MPDILFPAGRMVGGDINTLKPVIDDKTKQQRISPKDGKLMFDCAVGVAIPKTQPRWQDEFYDHPMLGRIHWGKIVYDTGVSAYPSLVATPSFSWKITDGDSAIPNKKGKRPCDKAGHPGHWVIWFSQGWLPKRVNATGEVELPDGAIVPGFYIQVFGSVQGNKLVPNGTPGVYLNPIAVALVGEGERIATDIDTTNVGFGGAALPAGATPVQHAAPQFAPPPVQYAVAPPPVPVVPNPAILQVPAPRQMTAKAAGATYEAFTAQGWTDAMLREQGYMV